MSWSQAVTSDTLNPSLSDGYQNVSNNEAVTFKQYIRYVNPPDGYVSWLLTQEKEVTGSLHIAVDQQQNEGESYAINRVVFTTSTEIDFFNDISPTVIWIGEKKGIRFAFSRRGFFFENAGLYHYSGDAVYPIMETQLLDVGAQSVDLIVSNSLPAWLTLNAYSPVWLVAPNPKIALYPSFLVPDNIRPPYGSVHIPESETTSFAGLPVIGAQGAHSQLTRDIVDITLYGLTNAQSLAFLDLVNQYALDTETFGMMAPAVVRDPKRTQTELGIIAMKKTLRFEVNYLQGAMPDVAIPLILKAPLTYILQ
jgi:hypothetical protein